jgi:malonyl CoA-acyl carrier protein transacylase
MGRDVAETFPAARALFERADAILGYPLARLCFEGPDEALRETERQQPAIFVTSLAIFEAARSAGALPDAVFAAGHSLGEYTALVAAGALDFEDGLRLVRTRGRLMQEAGAANPGVMAAIIGLDRATVERVCAETGAELCNDNAPSQIVIGGPPAAVERATQKAKEAGAQRTVPLAVSGAFHTSLMRPAAEGMARALAPHVSRGAAGRAGGAAHVAGAVGGQRAGHDRGRRARVLRDRPRPRARGAGPSYRARGGGGEPEQRGRVAGGAGGGTACLTSAGRRRWSRGVRGVSAGRLRWPWRSTAPR